MLQRVKKNEDAAKERFGGEEAYREYLSGAHEFFKRVASQSGQPRQPKRPPLPDRDLK